MVLNAENKKLVWVVNDPRLQFLLFSVLVYVLAVFEYQNFIVQNYAYMGYPNDFSVTKAVVCFLLYVFSHILLFTKGTQFIQGFTALLLLIFFMPILVLNQYSITGNEFVLFSVYLLILINLDIKVKLARLRLFKPSEKPVIITIIAVLLFIPFLFTFKVNFDSKLFLFGSEIYEVREGLLEKGNFFTNYMLSPLFQYVLPVVAIYGLSKRKFFIFSVAIGMSILMYLMIPQKSIFFGIFVVVFFYFFKRPIRKVAVFTAIVLGLFIMSIYLAKTNNFIVLESLLLRRYFLVPAFLNHVYFDFFNGEYLKYSYGFLKDFFYYPYDMYPAHLLGKEFFHGRVLNANNGFLSDGYINFGLYGMLVNTTIIAALIKFFDGLSLDVKFFGLFFLFLNVTRSSALPTMLLTHGVWLLILVAYLFLRKDKVEVI